MDGAKLIADTLDARKSYGRLAFCLGRSGGESRHGPSSNENLGGSRTIAV